MTHKAFKAFCLSLFLGTGSLYAQETVTTAGGDASGAGGTSSYTVGQVVYSTLTGTAGSVAQGVQQPYEISVQLGMEATNIHLEISAYPNPATDYLTLKVEGIVLSTLVCELYDVQGKLLYSNKLTDTRTEINMKGMSTSIYFLKVIQSDTLLKTFKIIKN